jgi:hypothetical protein
VGGSLARLPKFFAAIDRRCDKCPQRRERQAGRAVSDGANSLVSMLTVLPRAAELLRKQISKGLDGDPDEALKARGTLRGLFCGQVDLIPDENGELWAEYGLQPAALLQPISNRGSGGRI